MIPMNMMKKNAGFTLVELIVVMAILAILAGVAVPAYSGYLKSANEAADITALAAVKTAVQAALATEGEVTKIVLTDGNTDTYSVSYKVGTETKTTDLAGTNAGATDFAAYYAGNALTLKTGNKATWEKGVNNNEWKIETN
jgi:type IV pilus assembly protein PilA